MWNKLTERGSKQHRRPEKTTEMQARSLLATISARTISMSVWPPNFERCRGFWPINWGQYTTRFPAELRAGAARLCWEKTDGQFASLLFLG